MLHTLVAIVENKPGVLNRVASLFRRRNFNIASLTVGETENPDISRMTIVVDTKTTKPYIVTESLYKLVNVIEVRDLTERPSVQRDLVLLKVHTDSATRPEIMQFANLYHAKIVNVTRDCLMLEMTGAPNEVDNFVDIMRPFGIIEMVRTGAVAMEVGSNGHTRSNGHAKGNGHYIRPIADREGV
ncbi:MAG: acetolactate synthase small subunit [Chloroflexota bacterium]|nr:acetolactate synthase small subunit [Chloroflexota bacterium]